MESESQEIQVHPSWVDKEGRGGGFTGTGRRHSGDHSATFTISTQTGRFVIRSLLVPPALSMKYVYKQYKKGFHPSNIPTMFLFL